VPEDPYFAKLAALLTAPPQPLATDPALLASFEAMNVPPAGWLAPDVHVQATAVPGPHGDIPVRIYRRHDPEVPAPMLVHCHGGAWVAGDLDMPEAEAVSRIIAHRTGCVVMSVDYRLATEGVFYPVPLDDVVAAFTWAVDHAGDLGVDPDRVSLSGCSAGGNLAAAAALRLRDEGGHVPRTSVLIYPCVHAELPTLSEELSIKVSALSDAAAFRPQILTPVIENYLGSAVAEAPAYAMPALGELADLPPTLVINCEYDALRASGEVYAEALRTAGVHVEESCAPGVPHGHLNAPWGEAADASIELIIDWLQRLGAPAARPSMLIPHPSPRGAQTGKP
jgi:acetyl esterase